MVKYCDWQAIFEYMVYKPEGFWYFAWTTISLIVESTLGLMYSVYAISEFPEFQSSQFIVLVIFELQSLMDLIAGLFRAYKNEGEDEEYIVEPSTVTWHNLNSKKFLFDLITYIPWGLFSFMASEENTKLFRLLQIIKVFRIRKIYRLLRHQHVSKLVHLRAKSNLKELVEAESKMSPEEAFEQRNKDNIQVQNVIYGVYAAKIFKLAVTFIGLAYFFGIAWIIMAEIVQERLYEDTEHQFFTKDWGKGNNGPYILHDRGVVLKI